MNDVMLKNLYVVSVTIYGCNFKNLKYYFPLRNFHLSLMIGNNFFSEKIVCDSAFFEEDKIVSGSEIWEIM